MFRAYFAIIKLHNFEFDYNMFASRVLSRDMTHIGFCVLSALLQGGHKSLENIFEALSGMCTVSLFGVLLAYSGVYDKDKSARCPGILPYLDYNGDSVL